MTFLARPLPVEYLIIDVRCSVYFLQTFILTAVWSVIVAPPPLLQITTTFPKDPQYTFSSAQRFPIENRDILGETQVRNILTKSCLCKVNRKSSTGWVWIGSGVPYAAFRTTNISFIHL